MSKKNKSKTKQLERRKKEILKAQQVSGVDIAQTSTSVENKQENSAPKSTSVKTKTNVSEIDKKENLNDKLIKRDLYKTFGLTILAFLIIFLVWKFGSNYLPI